MALRLAVVSLLFATAAFCQNAQISGIIEDPSALNVPGALVTVRNEQTGGKRVTESDGSGSYSVPSLNPGTYRISVHANGFETIIREGVKLEVGDNVRFDFTLQIGDSRTVVTVTGGPPLMNTENASVGTVIDRKFIDELPLNGRGIQTLIELTPGVVVVPVSTTNTGQFAVNGQRSDANYFTVDGVSANFAVGVTAAQSFFADVLGQAGGGSLPANNLLGNFSNLVSPDALQEFQIQTSTFAPEFGRSPGAQVGLVTRSGTNRFSGVLFEYLRNDATDANDWFSNQQGQPKPPLRFNNFGGAFGGPIRIPHVYDGHDHSFFFFSLDDLVMRQPQQLQFELPVPSNQARSTANPIIVSLLDAFPLPNRPGSDLGLTDPLVAAYLGSYSEQNDQRSYGLRLDHYFSDKLTGFARYNQAPSDIIGFFEATELERYQVNTHTLTLGLTQIARSKLVNDIRLNASGQTEKITDVIDDFGGAKVPPSSTLLPPGFSTENSNVTISLDPGVLAGLSLGTQSATRSRQLQALDNVSYSVGTHQFKFGVDYRWLSPITDLPKLQLIYTLNDAGQTSGIASGLTIYRSQETNAYVVHAFSAYSQDTWRVSRSVAITYGIRWELDPAPHVSDGEIGAFQQLSSLMDLNNLIPVLPGRPFYRARYMNLAPRLGLAWQLLGGQDKKTVLRAGGGVFYDLAQSGFEDDLSLLPTSTATYTNVPLGTFPTSSSTAAPAYVPRVAAAPNYSLPRTYQWNVTLGQSFGQQTFSVGYVGALGRDLIGSSRQQLQFCASPSTLTCIPYVTVFASAFSSNYSALQLQFNRRVSQRVQALLSYTWSHSIDNMSSDLNSGLLNGYLLPTSFSVLLDPNLNRGSSDFDIRHSMNGAVLVALPSPRNGIGAVLLRNWTADSIFFARSAPPIDIETLLYPDYIRPNIVAGEPAFLYGPGYPGGKKLDSAAFSVPPGGTVEGDLGRNVLRGFGAWQIDFALHREIKLSDVISLQIRAEAFNVLNHPNFANPSFPFNAQQELFPGLLPSHETLATALGASGVQGELNPLFQIGGPRTMQFALRLKF